jgi:hypothetical protein
VPAAAGFGTRLDPRLVRGLEPAYVRLNGKALPSAVRARTTSRTEAVLETWWQTSPILRAGDVLDVGFVPSLIEPRGPLPSGKYPEVLLSPFNSPAGQRDTGRMSLTRLDTQWEAPAPAGPG